MLIVGNLANNYYCPEHRVSTIEIIYMSQHEKFLKDDLKIVDEPIFTNLHSSAYKVNDKVYILYVADEFSALKSLLKLNLAEGPSLKIASPVIAFIWNDMKTNYINISLNDWENTMQSYEYLYHKYIYHANDFMKNKITDLSKDLSSIGALGYNTKYKLSSPEVYTTYTKESLFDAFSDYAHPIYPKLIIREDNRFGEILSKTKWDTFSFDHKIDAVLEKLYVTASNEYLIKELLFNDGFDEDCETILKQTMMQLCARSTTRWLSSFIKQNYGEIIDKIDPLYIDTLYNSIKYNQLDKVEL